MQEAIDNADEVEWRAIKEGTAAIESGIADEQISGSLLDESELIDVDSSVDEGFEGTTDEPLWMNRAATEETLTGETAEEIERRHLLLGPRYPFKVAANAIEYVPSSDGIYELCLAISICQTLVPKPFNELPQAFEALSTELLTSWMGPGAKGWPIGFPGRSKVGLPSSLAELWKIIADETGEWEWQPTKEVADSAGSQKDLGMDTLIWKSVNDLRTHSLFLAGQCACGRDALSGTGKRADLDQKWLRNWFRNLSNVEFVPCLLMPRCLGSSATEVRAASGTLYFDRIRLVLAAEQCSQAGRSAVAAQSTKRYETLVAMVKETH